MAAWQLTLFFLARRPAMLGTNAIGNTVGQMIGIEPVSDSPVVAGAEKPRLATDMDSRARTHLANERTFLAWLRTGLSLVAVGLVVARFLPIDLVPGFPYVRSFSVLLVLCGTVMVLYGARRYVKSYQQIEAGSYDPAGSALVTIAAFVGLLGLLAIPLVLLMR